MIKWFCDLCGLEILAPENPVRVRAYRCGKSRDDAEIGWGHDDTIASVFCHPKCSVELAERIQAAFAVNRKET